MTMGIALADTTAVRKPADSQSSRRRAVAAIRRGGTQDAAKRRASAATLSTSRPAWSWAA